MKTEIFKSYTDFLQREDKSLNGVSEDFVKENPDYQEDNKSNKGCWNCSDCSDCFRCSDCSGCFRCSDCSDCFRCSDCSDCFRCSDCSGCSAKESNLEIPLIENIHSKVYEAVKEPSALDMSDWHTCESTHCRAGWVVHLAGKEGYNLEKQTSALFAAMQIYKKSSDIKVSPARFFEDNEKALEDIKRCAKEEQK